MKLLARAGLVSVAAAAALSVLLALAAVSPGPAARAAEVRVVALAPVEDVSFPYWCSWGYDWDERCYRDDSDRLPFGGAGDKVWRAALRFPVEALPPGALVLTAELSLHYDGVCTAPFRLTAPCDGRGFEFEAHPVYTERWSRERELEFGPAVAWTSLDADAGPQWVTWDLTDTVSDWLLGVPNDGVLLQLRDGTESFDVPGPAFASSTCADPELRPVLTVWYLPG
jgi:hypothetical protein